MDRENATEYLKGILGTDPTKEQVDNLLMNVNKNDQEQRKQIADLTEQIESLTRSSEKYKDYDDIKKQLDDINRANMTEQERLAEREKNIAKLEQETNRRNNRSIVKEVVSGLGLSDEVIESLVNDDANISKKNAENLVSQINSIKEATIKATKDELINVDVKPNMEEALPKDGVFDFEKFTQMSPEEQIKFANEHPDEFARL